MRRFFLAALVVVIAGGAVLADCRTVRRVVVAQEVIAPAVVKEVITPALVAQFVPIQVPVYSAGYVPQLAGPVAPPAAAAAEAATLERILARLDSLERRMAGGNAAPTPPAGPEKDAAAIQTRALTILNDHCARCHTGAAAKGKNMIFVSEGRLNPAVNKGKLFKAAFKGIMPVDDKNQPHPLPDEDVTVLLEWLGAP